MIKDIIDWTFSGVWLKFALALIAMFVFVLFFGVPDYNPQKTAQACKGINVPNQVMEIYKEEFCLCMGKDKQFHTQINEQICLSRIEKIKEKSLIN